MASKSMLCCLLFFFLHAAITACMGQETCTSVVFSSASSRPYTSCNSLPHLGASLHWTYHPSDATVDVAYRAKQDPTGWVGWGLNPSSSGMLEAQVLLAFPSSSDNGAPITVYTTTLDSYQPTIKNVTLSFPVYSRAAEYAGGFMTIYANLQLPKNSTKANHVWQAGTLSGGLPATHPASGDNTLSKGTIDFLSGESTAAAGDSRLRRKNTHGVLNAVSWGVLMPVGAIIARYLKVFKSADPAWFYLHVACQFSAYVIGVAGWGTGLKLGSESTGITYHGHRNIGIALFSLATLQVFALLLRPNKDNKHRIYWDAYHHSVGYVVILLSVINVFKGLDILDPEKKWKDTYIAIIVLLGAIALVLEVLTWVIVLKRRSRSSGKSSSQNDTNGYGRQNLGV
ncbi:putative cytochrome b561 and DOMON domain-containing protein [Iris pallida]|uniref:Cytochrome b561 and DOMON domain-containing protein n=1 Tax=Iris pallida TaxID=29817 RepID=A0AAX6EW40_IRIPA|nr:putative cytochrome b561 and DOMON domain-containing protein [Iris pallida]